MTAARDTTTAPSPASAGNPAWVLAILTVIGVFNWMDRSIISILLDPMKKEFHASDTLMGLLNGFGFSLLYALAAIPIARLADRRSRRNVLAIGLVVWSTMTAFCGLAQSFGQLLVARMGVGAGESAAVPTSQSLIVDFYPPERRAFALGVYTSSIYIGTTLSALFGGYVGFRFGWRVALVSIGLPGLLLALILVLTVSEPERGRLDRATSARPFSFAEAMRLLVASRPFTLTIAGMAVGSVVNGATLAWTPAFLGRVHHLDLKQLGLTLGLVKGVTGIAGVLLGGWLASRMAAGGVRRQLTLSAWAILLSIPPFLLFALAPTVSLCLVGVAIFQIFVAMPLGVTFAVIQELAPPTARALAASIGTLATTLIGIGGGPLYVGLLNDALTPSYGALAVRWSMVLLPFMVAGVGAFAVGARLARLS